MKKQLIALACAAALFGGCATEFNRVYKSQDSDYKYEYAKECFARGEFTHAVTLLQELVTVMKGTDNGEECLYMLGMAEYCGGDYESASATFKKYFSSYPKGLYAEQASFYVGQSLYESVPEPRLDQTPTIGAINAYQQFLDYYPGSNLRKQAQDKLFSLQHEHGEERPRGERVATRGKREPEVELRGHAHAGGFVSSYGHGQASHAGHGGQQEIYGLYALYHQRGSCGGLLFLVLLFGLGLLAPIYAALHELLRGEERGLGELLVVA